MKRANKQNQTRANSPRLRKETGRSRRRLIMENLEQRQLLSATGFQSPGGTGGESGYRFTTMARNIGSVDAVRLNEVEPNNTFATAQVLPLGTGPGAIDTIDLSGTLSTGSFGSRTFPDVDYFALDLRAGDILDIATIGSVGAIDLYFSPNQHWFGSEANAPTIGPEAILYPFESPLQTLGEITAAQTVPETGRYYLQVSVGPTSGIYTMGLRVYRPVMEQAPIGQRQILFLDFDGATYLESEFDPTATGVARLSPMSAFIQDWGLRPQDEDRIIDRIIEVVENKFEYIGLNGNNGAFATSGVPGEFGIEIRNSRDHVDEFGINPYVSRVIIGGTQEEAGVPTIGLAASIDIGNFATAESSYVLLDSIADLILPIEFAPGFTVIDTISTFLGNVAVHEGGHFFGSWHQDNANALVSIMDQGGDILGFTETGPDEIYGTADDVIINFTNDFFSPAEGVHIGRQDTVNAMAFNLSTGLVGGNVSGTVFNDANRSGTRNNNEGGVAGATVFLDLNGNGQLDSTEPSAVTSANGVFTLAAAAGTAMVQVMAPSGFITTTANPLTVTVPTNGGAVADFGVTRVDADVTGFKWADLDGNGSRDPGEPGIEGVYIFLDLDGDGRLDLGEPHAITAADGSYTINFPGPGNYVIREVVAPGYLQTFPPSGEHRVSYDGSVLTDNFNFGNQPVQDWGDAPFPYPTLAANNGAVHGIVNGLSLGATVDAEPDGQPTLGADGDDNSGLDDEDGVTILSALSPGEPAVIRISVTNTTGAPAYLSGWIDMQGTGDWGGPVDKFISDMVFPTSDQVELNFVLPASAEVGETYARFRLSQSPGVAATGFAAGGEVEDYLVRIAETPDVANRDEFEIPRGALAVPLNVLANDLDLSNNPLSIVDIDDSGTLGNVFISGDRRSVFYTPAEGRLGPDSFTYFVRSADGALQGSATVDLNVVFQSQVPIAIDDSFNLPERLPDQPLNVLANDIPSVAGGLRIIATSTPDRGGSVRISPGGQSIRYTPAASENGTEQFTYTVADANGQISTAVATIHLQPGNPTDDLASFIVETLAFDGLTPINTIPAGQPFKLRVSVDDLRNLNFQDQPGLGSAYLDLLYTDGLVAPVPGAPGSGFSFAINFGANFSTLQTGDASLPGIFNELGGTQSGLGTPFDGPAELFTITMMAVNPGIAEFVADPANESFSDVVFLNPANPELVPNDILFGRRQLTIVPGDSDFVFAVDDSYPDQIDSLGLPIEAGRTATFDVLVNDNFGPTGEVAIVNVGAATNGFTELNDDNMLEYTPRDNFVGVDQFNYTILSVDGIQSTAQVTVTVGNAAADDLVAIDLQLLDMDGNVLLPTDTLGVGERFQIQVTVEDLRDPFFGEARGVFAAYMDLLFDSILAEPVNANNSRFGFDVEFGANFDPNTAVGDSFVPGLINEFGTFQRTSQGSGDPLQSDPVLLATIDMIAKSPGTLRVIADPADVQPDQDTLLFQPPDVVPIGRIRYDVAEVRIASQGEGESPYQNDRNRWDVNNDGHVSPIDALLVLNRLNRGGEGESGNSGGRQVYWDVNGDNRMTPIDALQVINFLNNNRNGAGEGEGPSAAVGFAVGGPLVGSAGNAASGISGSDFTDAVDSIFGSLGTAEGEGDQLVADGGTTAAGQSAHGGQSVCLPATPSDSDDDDDDDDRELDLLGEV